MVGLMLVTGASSARADAVGPPPASCPGGSTGRTRHAGPWCEPNRCPRPGWCEGNLMCRDQGVCVIEEHDTEVSVSGVHPFTRRVALRTCDDDGDCTAPARCEIEQRCMPRSLGGCRCQAPGGGTGARAGGLVVLLLAALITTCRRRRR